ncbi:MAG TPA: O-antigen ligase family protein [Anaerolineae bacterium]|nr:O-antigen ligase family protein [Anaerolineae bacterium]
MQANHWTDVFISNRRWVATSAIIALSVLIALGGGLFVALLGGPIALGAILGLAVLVMILRRIEIGYAALIAVICLLPFAALPVNFAFKPTFLDVVLVALFGVWLLERATGKLGGFVNTPLTLPVLAFLAMALATFIAGLANAPLTQTVARHFAEIILSILLFFLITDTVRDAQRLRLITLFLIIGGSLAALIAIVLYLLPDQTSMNLLSSLRVFNYPTGPGVLRYINDDPTLPQRATGTSIDPNALGGLLIMMVTLTVPQLFTKRPVLPRLWVVVGLGMMGLALLLSFSRGSFVGAAVALGVLGVLRYRKLLLIMFIALVLVLILPQTQGYVTHFFDGLQALNDSQNADLSTQMRVGEYTDALTLIQRYPIFGVGFTGTPDIDTYLKVANLYLLMAGEMGLVGLATFLIVMATLFISGWRVRARVADRPEVEALWWGFHTALFGALIGGVFDHYFFNLDFHHSVTLFWLYVGLAAVSTRLVKNGALDSAERFTV